ncbi:MAG: hypothetical protein EXS68_01110 [Candidatus Ryanbacteria bacterium]|nr:hypothetical protein [Candidatus Ryanbacteria bacterium]
MQSESLDQLKRWIQKLPRSRMQYPQTLTARAKYLFWRVITPIHPYVRDLLLRLRILRHEGRQNFLLGKIAPHTSIKEFISHLIEIGYGNHFVAWRDDGELVSLRFVVSFMHQYHIRVYEDGEVRAHFEYTPECYPLWHMHEVDMESRREEFLKLMGDRIELAS